ncbi:MAG: phosphatidylserine decarboxylase [Methylobacteriaceae bacterium]|jgi:phosphatidylserine decarboxylase|nr:phosphatidylserine decarboxylase [Methylobacteriaceae bacterium]
MHSLIDTIRGSLCPVHKQGYLFVFIALVVTLILRGFWSPLGWIGLIITLWIAYFFRDPTRVTPQDVNLVISPADGKISQVTKALPPRGLDLPEEPMTRISIFMNVFDCHVNRSPAAGAIRKILYHKGVFLNAELDKASEENERMAYLLDTAGHGPMVFVQIAGFVARRIVSFVGEGQRLDAGERFGLIRFGSRLDVYLPDSVDVMVGIGQRAVAGETVLASFAEPETGHVFKAS